MMVRARDEGSVYPRKDGRWVAALRWPDGQRKYRYARTKRLAAAKLAELRALRESGSPPPDDRLTVSDWLDRWLRERVSRLAVNTQVSYQRDVDRYIRPDKGPSLGRERLVSLSVRRVAAWVDDMLEAGVPAPTAAHCLIVLRTALKAAMREDLIIRNPASLVEAPRYRARKGKPFTAGEATGLLAAIRQHRLYALIVLALTSGLRRGELLGLTWGAVHLDEAYLHVLQQLQRRTGEGLVLVPTKSERSEAPVALTSIAVRALRAHRARLIEQRIAVGDAWKGSANPVAPGALVFPSLVGTPADGPGIWRQWSKLLADAGLEHHRMHDSRHTTATLLRALGVPAEVVQDVLRHAHIATQRAYVHTDLSQQRAAAAALDELLAGVLG